RLPAGGKNGVSAGFELTNARGEFEDRGRAVEAVGIADAELVPGVADGGSGGKHRGRAAIDGRGEGAVALGDFRVGMDEFGLPAFGHGAIPRQIQRARSSIAGIIRLGPAPRLTTIAWRKVDPGSCSSRRWCWQRSPPGHLRG